jgi:hypothetical protein
MSKDRSINIRKGLATACLFLTCACAHGEAVRVDDFHWKGVDRIVAISDLHGDYDQYFKVMRSAGLVNSRGKWSGGETHLVQTGDVPDRGPDTRRILDHLAELKEQAVKKGGRVHTLIGNHEAMNTYGDLRYVHPGEFADFAGKNAKRNREKQWEFTLNRIKQIKPEEFLTMDLDAYRAEFEQKTPLGWVEHRVAWQPAGEYGQWVMSNPIAVMVNDTIFLHGGLGPEYCHLSLREISEQGWAQLQNYDHSVDGVVNDEDGPLWYRGLAREDEDYFAPAVEQILERYGAARIVVGHTPTGGVVWPRFNGRVVVNDTGIAAYYGSNDAYLELTGNTARAGYGEALLDLPSDSEGRIAYLRSVIGLRPDNDDLKQRLAEMLAPPPPPVSEAADGDVEETTEPVREPISPGICQ